jgi:hypothetical protein
VINQQHEVPLSDEEVHQILLQCGTEALLVGGQALAIWAEYLKVAPTGELSAKVTADADFIGSQQVAKRLSAALRWHIYLPTIEDATPHAAKVSTTLPDGGIKQVDFLNAIAGLDTEKVQARAAELQLPSGIRVRILSPPDVLESRLRNLELLPQKRNTVGIAQAELAIAIVGKFFDALIESDVKLRTLLDAVKRVGQIAFDPRLSRVCFEYGLNPLAAVPSSRIKSPAFQKKRWPQMLANDKRLRKKHSAARAPLKGPAGAK